MTTDFSHPSRIVTKDQVMSEADEAVLQDWYRTATDIATDIQVQLDSFNDAIRPQDDPWFIRACGAMNANRMLASWSRRRMLELGVEPKRPESDPLVVREKRVRGLLRVCRAVIRGALPDHKILADLDKELGEGAA
jgi:hypothetical protein